LRQQKTPTPFKRRGFYFYKTNLSEALINLVLAEDEANAQKETSIIYPQIHTDLHRLKRLSVG
jgi:hypothetical protein